MDTIAVISEYTAIPLILLIIGGGIFLTIRLDFFQFRYFPHIIKRTVGGIFRKTEAGEGTVTPFQAVSSALASTVGSANIIGVPVAIAFGGPGAVFWMWLVALIGMATKYSEVVLGITYRIVNKKGDYVGGAMYYMDKGLGWKGFAVMFAAIQVIFVFASTSVQSNSLAVTMKSSFQIPTIVTGIVISGIILLVMLGGIKSIGQFAEKCIPTMVTVYMLAALIVIVANIDAVPHAFFMIFKHAFTPISAMGGFAGAAIAAIIRWGVARGVYSNEAGMGSASIAHSGAKNEHPATQGFWGVFEVFVDTILVCTVTALVILTTDVWTVIDAENAASMTMAGMADVFGQELAGIIVNICLFFFSITTILMIVYFGEKQSEYLFGHKTSLIFRYVYIGAVLFGSTGSLLLVWSLLDVLIALMVVPNMIALISLSGKVREITRDYFTRHYKEASNFDNSNEEKSV